MWNKETQTINMYFAETFYDMAPLTATQARDVVEENMLCNLEGVSRELMLITLSKVDWDYLAEIFNEQVEGLLYDEF